MDKAYPDKLTDTLKSLQELIEKTVKSAYDAGYMDGYIKADADNLIDRIKRQNRRRKSRHEDYNRTD